MDKRHREELEQNDLESFLFHLGEWWEKQGLRFLTALLVVVVAYTAWTWFKTSRYRANQEALLNLETSTSPDSLGDVAQTSGGTQVATLAYLRGADLALAKAALPSAPPPLSATTQEAAAPPEPPLTDEARKRLLDDAEMMYKEVIQKPDASLLLKLNAKLGLAAVDESRSAWTDAGTLYHEVIDQAGTYEVLKAKAQGHLAMLDRLSVPVAFAPEPLPAATMPALSNILRDTTMPATTSPAAMPPLTEQPATTPPATPKSP